MFRIANASCKTLADTGPRRLGETSILHVVTKGAQKLCLLQLRGMKLSDRSLRLSLNNLAVSHSAGDNCFPPPHRKLIPQDLLVLQV